MTVRDELERELEACLSDIEQAVESRTDYDAAIAGDRAFDFLRDHGPALLSAFDAKRAIEEQAAVTECVSVAGREPSAVIRDIIHWHAKIHECAVVHEFAGLLPGPHYMDPPDGGDVSVVEQGRRMAEDAERYRWLRTCHEAQIGERRATVVMWADEPWEPEDGVILDEAIDKARAGK